MPSTKQHELGIAGLALLRTWLIGNKNTTKTVLKEIKSLTNNKIISHKNIDKYGMKEGYRLWASTYDIMPNLLIEIEEPIVKSLLKKFAPGNALDAACGTGRYSKYLEYLGHRVTGLDLSPAMLSKAKAENLKINFIKGNLEKLPFKDYSFDLVVCALTLTHLPNIKPAISELFRVLRPGGHVILSDIHPWIVAMGGQADFHDEKGNHGYITNYIHWHSKYFQNFKDTGFEVEQFIEPKFEETHLKLAQSGLKLSKETMKAAFVGLPMALTWLLRKP